MKLRELFNIIEQIAKTNKTSAPLICGGTVRDKVLGKLQDNFSDIDITTGDSSVKILAQNLGIELKRKFNITSKQADDGHISIFLKDLKLDFSSNFISPSIIPELLKKGIKSPTNLQKEMFSRDFTCNALLMSFDLKTITDPTKSGLSDINNKIIKTCLPPEITLSDNPNRIVRAIYLSAKLDFDVDPSIIEFIKQNKNLIKLSSDKYLIKNLDKAMKANPKRTVALINEMNLWDVFPITADLAPFSPKSKTAQLRRNFDYGEGLYMNLDKYKSVDDFRKKRRKKRIKELKKIREMKAL